MSDDLPPECCRTCGGPRYCAPARCYCGHKACPAEFAPLPPLRDVEPTIPAPSSSAWDNREGSTWIDSL